MNKKSAKSWQSQALLGVIVLLQAAWLCVIWLTGAATTHKVPLLMAYTLLVGGTIIFGGPAFRSQLEGWFADLQKQPRRWLVILCIGIVGIGMVYAAYKVIWPFDEDGAFAASWFLAKNGPAAFFRRYTEFSWLGAQHPPLIILLNGLVLWLFGGALYTLRMVTLVFTVATVIVTYLLGRRFYDATTGILAAFALATFPLFLRLGTGAMTDMQVTFFATLTIYLLSHLADRPTFRVAVLAGLTMGLSLLTKYTAALMGPVYLSYLLIQRVFLSAFAKLTVLALITALLLSVWFGYAYSSGIFNAQFSRLSLFARTMTRAISIEAEPISPKPAGERAPRSAPSAESRSAPNDDEQPARVELNYGAQLALETALTRLPSALGVYTAPLLLLGLLSLWRHRQRVDWFLVAWISIVWVLLFLTVPDHRYFMLTFPALAIVAARGLMITGIPAPQILLLNLCYWAGALYLLVDWKRGNHIFL